MDECDLTELKVRIEALLFSSKTPLRIVDIASILNADRTLVRKGMRSLLGDYRRRNTAIEIIKSNGRFLLRLKPEYDEVVRPVVPPELDRSAIKTMAYIAYYQPIRKGEIVARFGTKVYRDLNLLEEKDLIRTKGKGKGKVLVTGPRFAEYFGLKSSKPEHVRAWIAEKLGGEPAPGKIEEGPPPRENPPDEKTITDSNDGSA